jgi:hypothetical protein
VSGKSVCVKTTIAGRIVTVVTRRRAIEPRPEKARPPQTDSQHQQPKEEQQCFTER